MMRYGLIVGLIVALGCGGPSSSVGSSGDGTDTSGGSNKDELSGLPRGYKPTHHNPRGSGESMVVGNQKLRIPKGCEKAEGRRVRCDGAELYWRRLTPEQSKQRERIWAMLRDRFARMGRTDEDRITCELLGTKGSGRKFRLDTEEGVVRIVVCHTRINDHPVMAQCTITRNTPGTYPPPCDQAFTSAEIP